MVLIYFINLSLVNTTCRVIQLFILILNGKEPSTSLIVPQEEMSYFYNLAHTIGGYLIFPGNRINGLPKINQERGTNKRINDRIDLTLECIRLFYNNENNPMTDTLIRYKEFFSLFTDFKGYCEFFFLQDIVSQDYSKVNFFFHLKMSILIPCPKT